MSLLSLIMKIYYNHSKNLTELQSEILIKEQNSIMNKAIQSLQLVGITLKLKDDIILNKVQLLC